MPIFEWDIPPAAVTPPVDEVPIAYGPEAYASQLLQLLPRGILWNTQADSKLRAVMLAIGDEFSRVDQRSLDLLEEMDPRTATETIEDWERILSLPDDRVLEIPATIEARRVAVTQKFVSLGGQSAAFFTALALACGYVLDPAGPITKFANSVLRVGFLVGARVYGDAYAYSMQINISSTTGSALSNEDFERVIRHVVHSHIVVIFNYE